MDKIFNKPFAINGARVTIPENGTENERVSFDKGFTQPYEVEAPSVDNPNGQGFNILRPEMNEILNQLSNACNFLAENIDKWTKLNNENLNNITTAGRYYQQNGATGFIGLNYPSAKLGFLIVLRQNPNINYITQIYKAMAENIVYFRYSRDGGATWSDWDTLVFKAEFDTKITQLQNEDTNLNNAKEDKTHYHTQNLTNLNGVKDNRFYSHGTNTQNAFANVSNYLFNMGAENGAWVRQISFPCISNEIGVRRTTIKNDLNSWSDWDSVALKSFTEAKYRKIADSYTKTETDTQINNAVNSTTHRYRTIKCNPSENTIQWQTGGFSIAKQNAYTIRITHNIGTASYSVSAIINRASIGGVCSPNLVSVTANYCDISFHWATHNDTGSYLPTLANITFFY